MKENKEIKWEFGDFFKNASPQEKKAVFTPVLEKVNQEQGDIVRQYNQRKSG